MFLFGLIWCSAFLAYDVAYYVDTGRPIFLACAIFMAAMLVLNIIGWAAENR